MKSKGRSVKITKRVVDSIEPADADFYVFDSELIGFGLRVRKTGGCPTLSGIGPGPEEGHLFAE
jgi:hypothetical protein